QTTRFVEWGRESQAKARKKQLCHIAPAACRRPGSRSLLYNTSCIIKRRQDLDRVRRLAPPYRFAGQRGFGGGKSIHHASIGSTEMHKFLLSAVAAAALFSGGSAAQAACGDVTLAEFSWQSAEAMSNVDQFILNNGYGCNATIVAGDTVPT